MAHKIMAFSKELDKSLENIIPGIESRKLQSDEFEKLFGSLQNKKYRSRKLKIDIKNSSAILLLSQGSFRYGRKFLFDRKLGQEKKDNDIIFLECYKAALIQDLNRLNISDFDGAIELSLRETRFREMGTSYSPPVKRESAVFNIIKYQ